jgi:hypothetical protein
MSLQERWNDETPDFRSYGMYPEGDMVWVRLMEQLVEELV